MILFFDRSIGTIVPQVLVRLKIPVQVEWHEKHFRYDEFDDVWLPVVGQKGWIVIGHDKKYHLMPNELMAIKQHKIGCFYLWGAEAIRWEKMRIFALAYERILKVVAGTKKPFIFDIDKRGALRPLSIP